MIVPTNSRRPATIMAISLLALSLLLTLLAVFSQHQPVQAAPTATTLGGTVIVTDTVWTAANSPYIIAGVVSIQAGVVLTIEPGVIVQAAGSGFAVLSVEEGAHLAAIGSPTLPITFTSVADSGPGDWADLVIIGSAHFNYTSFRNSDRNISLFGSTGGQVLVENSTISEGTYGLESYANALHRLQLANVTFTNNINNRIRIWASITGHELVDNVTLTAQPGLEGYEVVYENSGDFLTIPSGMTLTLEAGATLMMGGIYQLLVVDGHLQTLGTPTMPVTITSANPAPGNNYYILFQGESIHFNHTVVQYADAAIVINGTDPDAEIFVENSIIRDGNVSILILIDALHQLRLENVTFVDNVYNRVIIETYDNDPLVDDVTLTSQPGLEGYQVFAYNSNFSLGVPEGITLTLEPGVMLMMPEDTRLLIDGYLEAIGTITSPITFTSALDSGPSQWYGLVFGEGSGILDNITIRYGYCGLFMAGNQGVSGAVLLKNSVLASNEVNFCSFSASSVPSQISLEDTVIQSSVLEAVRVDGSGLSNSHFSNVSFQNNGFNHINVEGTHVISHTSLAPHPGLEAYVFNDLSYSSVFEVPVGITLTIEPGVTVLNGDVYWAIEGSLQAIGTMTRPITFTSIMDTGPGQWQGLAIKGSGRLEWTTSRHAGFGLCVNENENSDTDDQVIIKNSIFQNNELGICIYDLNPIPRHVFLENVVLRNNGSDEALLVDTGALSYLEMVNVQFQDNAYNRIGILTNNGMINKPLTGTVNLSMQPGLEAYAIASPWLGEPLDLVIPANVSLTLASGVELIMLEDLAVQVNGRLQTNGTPTQPVTITSFVDSGPGEWQGLRFDHGEGYLQHTTVRYGESNISLTGPTATLYLSHTQSTNGLTGLAVHDGSVLADCSTFANHQADGISIANGGSPDVTVFSSNLFNNGGAGVNNSGGALVEARNNWWGDASGPGGIGPGNGDEISGTVAFDPWLTEPECLTVPDDAALADLKVALMASSSSVPTGGVLTYTVTVSNSGPQTATAVSLTNELPPEVTLVALPPDCTGTATLTCSLGSLLPNNPLTLSYQVRADGILSGVITNSVTVTAAELDSFPANNEATVTTTVLAPLVGFDSSTYSVMEGKETAVLTVSLNFAPATTVTVVYATLGGTAEEDEDYLFVIGSLIFSPGNMVQTVVIPILDDGLVEEDEIVLVQLFEIATINAILENDIATLTILDNEQHYHLYLPLVNKP